MEHLLSAIIGILLLAIAALLAKIYFLRRAAREIIEAFGDRLAADTNTLIDISSKDACMRKLAAAINEQLRILRKQRHRYLSGDRELKEAVTNVSHDLRTPLTAVCGYIELLEKEEKSENAARYLSLIGGRIDAMKRLTEELLRYSVILSSGELELGPVHVNGVLEESIAAFHGALTARGILPRIDICEKRVERRLNRDALGRVFGNILSNALKYSDGDLDITLRDSGEVVFSNTASGLNEIQAGRLFDRFFTVETARNSGGLGLSIAKTLVEQMGGTITAAYGGGRLSISIKLI